MFEHMLWFWIGYVFENPKTNRIFESSLRTEACIGCHSKLKTSKNMRAYQTSMCLFSMFHLVLYEYFECDSVRENGKCANLYDTNTRTHTHKHISNIRWRANMHGIASHHQQQLRLWYGKFRKYISKGIVCHALYLKWFHHNVMGLCTLSFDIRERTLYEYFLDEKYATWKCKVEPLNG